jgi:hypothetical protein
MLPPTSLLCGQPAPLRVSQPARITAENCETPAVWDVYIEVLESNNDGPHVHRAALKFDVLAPSATTPTTPNYDWGYPIPIPPNPLLVIKLRDASGITWERDEKGILRLIDDPSDD